MKKDEYNIEIPEKKGKWGSRIRNSLNALIGGEVTLTPERLEEVMELYGRNYIRLKADEKAREIKLKAEEEVREIKDEHSRLKQEHNKIVKKIEQLKTREKDLSEKFDVTLSKVKGEIKKQPEIDFFEQFISEMQNVLRKIKAASADDSFGVYEQVGSLELGKEMLMSIEKGHIDYQKEYDRRKNTAVTLTDKLYEIEGKCKRSPEYGVHLALSKALYKLIDNSYDVGYNTTLQDSIDGVLESMNENIAYRKNYKAGLLRDGKKSLMEIKNLIDRYRGEVDTVIVDHWFGLGQTLYEQAEKTENSNMVEGLVKAIEKLREPIKDMLKQGNLRLTQERYIKRFCGTIGRQVCPKCKGKGML